MSGYCCRRQIFFVASSPHPLLQADSVRHTHILKTIVIFRGIDSLRKRCVEGVFRITYFIGGYFGIALTDVNGLKNGTKV